MQHKYQIDTVRTKLPEKEDLLRTLTKAGLTDVDIEYDQESLFIKSRKEIKGLLEKRLGFGFSIYRLIDSVTYAGITVSVGNQVPIKDARGKTLFYGHVCRIIKRSDDNRDIIVGVKETASRSFNHDFIRYTLDSFVRKWKGYYDEIKE